MQISRASSTLTACMLLCIASAAVYPAPMSRHGVPWRLVAKPSFASRDECSKDVGQPGRPVNSSVITDKTEGIHADEVVPRPLAGACAVNNILRNETASRDVVPKRSTDHHDIIA